MALIYASAKAITKSDTTNIDGSAAGSQDAVPADGIYVGGAGVVPAVFPNGVVVNFTAVAGEILPIRAIRVNSTNCTATVMVALYL